MPKLADGPWYAAAVSTGLLCCKPYSDPPGCTAANRFAVDKARPGKLNELAVFAFCAEMTRLPGHSEPRSAPVKATAQTTPSRLTIAAISTSCIRNRFREADSLRLAGYINNRCCEQSSQDKPASIFQCGRVLSNATHASVALDIDVASKC